MTTQTVKQQVVDHFGGPSALAKKLGCRPQAVSQWEAIPEARAYQIEVLSDGRFTAGWIKAQQNIERQQPDGQAAA